MKDALDLGIRVMDEFKDTVIGPTRFPLLLLSSLYQGKWTFVFGITTRFVGIEELTTGLF